MNRENIRICVMRVAGTNRDADAAVCLEDQGAIVEILHLNDILRRRNLATYQGLVFPGGFAYGDYVRAGAIWAKRIQNFLREDLRAFAEAGKPILGICNGFQVLVEAGFLPFLDYSESPVVSLAGNKSGKFECRWVGLKSNPDSSCIFNSGNDVIRKFPIAHGEGRFITNSQEVLDRLAENNQIALQYVKPDGELAKQCYPENPNGSELDIAGICSPSGTIMGLMPHPEDAYWGYQMPNWTEMGGIPQYGDGVGIFKSMIDYIEKRF
jgi:phosphoribosylformylglycinamidine synthase subunit PurQ / glutaminase